MRDIIIIGAGPAGVTAAIYAARKRLKTLVLAKDFLGQPGKTSWVDNYPGLPHIKGLDLAQAFEKHLRSFEDGDILTIKQEEVTGLACHPEGILPRHPERSPSQLSEKVGRVKRRIPLSVHAQRGPSSLPSVAPQDDPDGSAQNDTFIVTTASGNEYRSRALIIATGRDPRPLEVPGEKALIGKGVSYCSICDAPFFKGKRVAVIGGGNSGLEAALDLAQYAERIYILEFQSKLRADEVLQHQVKAITPSSSPQIQIFLNKKLTKIEGKNKVEDIVYQDTKTKKTFQVGVDGVFVAAGTVPITYFAKEMVDLNAQDEIIVDPQTCATSQPGVFAAGDVNDTKWKQIVMATAQGARAALAAYEYLQSTNSTPS